jgi:predicted PurR-regulated permease PerM
MKITKQCAFAHSFSVLVIAVFASLFMLLLDGSFIQTWICGVIAATTAGVTKEFADTMYGDSSSWNWYELLVTMAGGIVGGLIVSMFVI